MNDPVNAAELFLRRAVSSLQGAAVCCISGNIDRLSSEGCQPVELRLDGSVLRAPSDPGDTRLPIADHVFTPCLADAAGSADDHVCAAFAIQASFGGIAVPVNRDQLLAEPLSAAVSPCVALPIRRQRENVLNWPYAACFQIDQPEAPIRIFFGERTDQTMYAGMSRANVILLADGLRLPGNDRPADCPASAACKKRSLDQLEQLNDAALLRIDQRLFRRGAGSRVRCDP
ncbi:hypothetical protein D3C84_783870 [compost metagenome]